MLFEGLLENCMEESNWLGLQVNIGMIEVQLEQIARLVMIFYPR